ncbi:protein Wnt-1-like [Sitodiplosis mosellana]|uniref:protein Wnt-1-like n=1 Tax=Sitodiplosis mosellana TaxID=263140 RepID=UPI002444CC28|nr:protein Wnt-1-like [Sitodiplosis mosellana]XP_055324288.1 protein Wnt-1-like [Sitodiplosis mosellana]
MIGSKRNNHVPPLMTFTLLIAVCMGFAYASWWDLGLHALQNVGLFDPNALMHHNHEDICKNALHLSNEQRRMCARSPRVFSAIVQGAKMGQEECQHQFRNSRWNCTTSQPSSDLQDIYGDVMRIKSRETAYIHAINAASLAWSITRACSRGDLTECSCDNTIRRKQRKWQWGGCSEDINYGVLFSRKFIDSQESNETAAGLMNLHNNEAGRRALRSRMQRVCKCHGVSGSCSIRVCWRRLPALRAIGEALGQLYDGASHVKLIERDGRVSKLRRRDPQYKKLIKSDLVYLEDSPDYCDRDDELGILGTKGRLCNRTSPGIDGCKIMCCGRGHQTRIRFVEEKCKCRFVWCCDVKCEMCNHRREEHICN